MDGMKFHQKLAILRQNRRLSQSDLAKSVDCSQGTISRWEKGDGKPELEQALKLSRELGVPLEFLADDQADEAPAQTEPESPTWIAIREIAATLGPQEAMKRLLRPVPTSLLPEELPPRPSEVRVEPRRGTG